MVWYGLACTLEYGAKMVSLVVSIFVYDLCSSCSLDQLSALSRFSSVEWRCSLSATIIFYSANRRDSLLYLCGRGVTAMDAYIIRYINWRTRLCLKTRSVFLGLSKYFDRIYDKFIYYVEKK